jgi:hypothetical protein
MQEDAHAHTQTLKFCVPYTVLSNVLKSYDRDDRAHLHADQAVA